MIPICLEFSGEQSMLEFIETTVDKFIFRVATDRFYSTDGIWAQEVVAGERVRVGLSDYSQQRMGDAAFVHVKLPGTRLAPGKTFAEIESIKSNADLFSPVKGVISDINKSLVSTPEIVNQDPYDKGWLAEIAADDWKADQARLLKPVEYLSVIREQAEKELNDS
jgi:glycine cleavage system H protein